MNKSLVVWSVVGVLIGAGTVLLLTASLSVTVRDPRESPSVRRFETPSVSSPISLTTVGPFRKRLEQYQNAAQVYDSEALASQIRSILRQHRSSWTTEVEVLLSRLFELDPERAADLLSEDQLPSRMLERVFRRWARIDLQAAIGALARLGAPEDRVLALAIIGEAGAAAIDDIIIAVPRLNSADLVLAAVVRRAGEDPDAALREILALPDSDLQQFAVAEVGRIAAESDPEAGVSSAMLLHDFGLKKKYLEELYSQWALVDVSGLLAHLESLPSDRVDVSTIERAIAQSADSSPEQVLEFGRQSGGSLRLAAEAAALRVLSKEDPERGVRYLDAVAVGERREALAVAIATGFARNDMASALRWAGELRPRAHGVKHAVLQVLASYDLSEAVRIELEDPGTTVGAVVGSPIIPAWFGSTMISELDDPHSIADQLAASTETGMWKERMLETLLYRWVNHDINGALSWMQSNKDSVPVRALETASELINPNSIDQIIALGNVLPPAKQPQWISWAVRNSARVDPNIAMAAINRYQSEPFYESLHADVVRTVASTKGPEVAVTLIGTTPSSTLIEAIGREWANVDPVRAMAWADSLRDEPARIEAVRVVTDIWAGVNAEAAAQHAGRLADPTLSNEMVTRVCRRFPEVASCR